MMRSPMQMGCGSNTALRKQFQGIARAIARPAAGFVCRRTEGLERVTGIEPVTEAWEAFVIPFHHTRITLVR